MFNNPTSPFNPASFLSLLLQSHYLGAASLTFFVYDILLTFDDEVKYIYQTSIFKLGLPKILYLLNRYYTLTVMIINTLTLLLPNPSTSLYVDDLALLVTCPKFTKSPSCVFGTRWSSVGGILTKFVLDVWLVLRVYAMWNRDARVLTVLLMVFLGNVAFGATLLGIVIGRFIISAVPPHSRLPGATGCAVTGSEGHFWLTFVTSLMFEFIVVSFTIARAVMQHRAGFSRRDTPLATHLYKTGVLYFLIVGSVMAFMSMTALTPPFNGVVLPAQFICAIISTVGARMMLSIRKVFQGDDQLSDLRPSDVYLHFQTSECAESSVVPSLGLVTKSPQEHEMHSLASAPSLAPRPPLKDIEPIQPPQWSNRTDPVYNSC